MSTATAAGVPSPEATLLGDLLLAPAALRDFMTLRQFTAIFPRAHRAHPGVQQLYRELQRLRARDMATVRRDIAHHVQRSKPLRHAYARERRRRDGMPAPGLDPIAFQMEAELSGGGRKQPHTLHTAHARIHEASHSLEHQIAAMEAENARALLEVDEVVGALSDLRHGRFAPSASGEDIEEEVLATLKRLEAVCAHPAG